MSRLFIRRAFIFSGIFLLSYSFSLLLIGRNMNLSFGSRFYYPEGGAGHSQLRFQEAASQKDLDLLFIGSSHAYRNYDPRIFDTRDLRSFNLGSTAQTPIQTLRILQTLGENLSPKCLIIDFFLPLFYNEGIESSIDLLANTNFYPMQWAEHEDMKWYNAVLFRNLSKNIFNLKSKQCAATIGTDQYIRGGYVESHQTFNSKHETPKSTGELNPKQIQAFAQIIEWADEQKIKWIIVQSPILNGNLAESYQALPAEVRMLFPEKNFINGQSAFPPKSEFFIDADHLNARGVEKFNSWLLDTLYKKAFF
jgi:hypothetical protein